MSFTTKEGVRRHDGREAPMGKLTTNSVDTTWMRTVFGIDSHSRTTTICALVPETGEIAVRTFRNNDYRAMRTWMAGSEFPGPSLGVYEAGCTGFVPARELSSEGARVVPIATSKVPSSMESRTMKNDRRDAERLARLAVAGELREVWVPSEEVEGLREVSHALDDLRDQRTRAYQRVHSLLCRHNIVWDQRTPRGRLKGAWGLDFWAWLRAIELPDAGSQAALEAAIRAADSAREQYDDMLLRAREVAGASSLDGTIQALQCLKCVSFVTSLAFAAEVGDFARFPSGRKVTSWLGLAPSEASSGLAVRLGGVTKCGCTSLRRRLVECAWSAVRVRTTRAKPCTAVVDPHVRERALTLSRRLRDHRRSLVDRGVAPCKANAATAAELGRFMLFLGREQQAAEAGA